MISYSVHSSIYVSQFISLIWNFWFFSECRAVGVGKSEIVRSALRAMTKMPNLTVRSPTFTIDITYEHAGQKYRPFFLQSKLNSVTNGRLITVYVFWVECTTWTYIASLTMIPPRRSTSLWPYAQLCSMTFASSNGLSSWDLFGLPNLA